MIDLPDEPYPESGQLMLEGFGVNAGERYRNQTSGTIVTVLGVEQRKYAWVTIRVLDQHQTITLESFLRTFARM